MIRIKAWSLACAAGYLVGLMFVGGANAGCTGNFSGGNHYHVGTTASDTCQGADHLDGGAEFFDMKDGADTVSAANSPASYYDKVEGAGGNDTFYGQGGKDTLWGEADRDILDGGEGPDELHGGADYDQFYGGPGDDYIYGGDYQDALKGGDGNDRIYDNVGGSISEKDHVCGYAKIDRIDISDGDEEDYWYDPRNEDAVFKDPGEQVNTSSECGF